MASASSSSSRSDEGSDPCPICLQSKQDEAYLDHCFHSFCYDCITYWTRVVTAKHSQSLSSIKCPLCKVENSSIINGFDGRFFQRHYVNNDHGKSCLSSAHELRLKQYNSETGIKNHVFDVQQFWKHRRYLKKNNWLKSWLRREIQVLVQEDDVDIIVHHIHGVIESFLRRQERSMKFTSQPEQKRDEFRALLCEAAMPFILGQAERFVDELELFLASGLNIEAYDKKLSGMPASNESRGHEIGDPGPQFYRGDFLGEDINGSD